MRYATFLFILLLVSCVSRERQDRYDTVQAAVINNSQKMDIALEDIPSIQRKQFVKMVTDVKEKGVRSFVSKYNLSQDKDFEFAMNNLQIVLDKIEASKNFIPDSTQLALFQETKKF